MATAALETPSIEFSDITARPALPGAAVDHRRPAITPYERLDTSLSASEVDRPEPAPRGGELSQRVANPALQPGRAR